MSTFRLTDEQGAVSDGVASGDNLVVEAGAGAGKTSTLKASAKRIRGRARYLAYNSAAAKEAKASFPTNVKCSTIHGCAWRSTGVAYAERRRVPLPGPDGAPRQPGWRVAEILRITQTIMCDQVPVEPHQLGRIVIETLNQWCCGIDPAITTEHVPWQRGLSQAGNAYLASEIVPLARRAWQDVRDVDNGQLNVAHDFYLRMWWDSGKAKLWERVVLYDEAQDANPLAAAIIQSQQAQLVAVGDSYQSLYEWRGAINALDDWPADQVLYLTQSFRFGEAVAEEANKYLELMGAKMRIRGTPARRSLVVPELELPRAVLCRTNMGAMAEVMKALDAGRKPALAKGGETIKAFAEAARQLQDGHRTAHPDLFAFPTWEAVKQYVETEEGQDLRVSVSLIEDYGADQLIAIVDSLADDRNADVTISTVHGAKGLEWSTVGIGEDFLQPGFDSEGHRRPMSRTLGMLAYVAVTRPREVLGRGSLSWVDEWLRAA